jgi:hypothetical protein
MSGPAREAERSEAKGCGGSEEIAPNLVSPLYNSAVTNPNFRVGPEITSNRNCQNLMNSRVVEKFFELEAA